MVLCHTTGTALEGPTRLRQYRKFKGGKIVRRKWTLRQPDVHAKYRAYFSAVDVFNKLALGPVSVATCYKTRDWRRRFFCATVALC